MKFIRNFSGICAPIIDTIKKDRQPFYWTTKTEKKLSIIEEEDH